MKLFMDLEHRECRWSVGKKTDEGQFFCAEPTEPQESYCPEHKAKSLPKGFAPARMTAAQYEKSESLGATRKQQHGRSREQQLRAPYDRDTEPDLCVIFAQ